MKTNDDGTMRGLRYWNNKMSSEIEAYLDRTDGTTNDMEIHCREQAWTVLESRSLRRANPEAIRELTRTGGK